MREVFSALSKEGGPGLALRLSTGFGGGKTHTLLTLWHLARNISTHELVTELLPAPGRATQVHVAAVDGARAGHPVFAQHGVDIDELTHLALAPSDHAFSTQTLRAAGTQADSDRRP